jgi:undecaprenyl diphosphate synthase
MEDQDVQPVKVNRRINPNTVPRHISFIMDGNGRWARLRGLARIVGHEHGYARLKTAALRCADLGVKYVSVFAFSTENWQRPKDEVDAIFRIIRENIDRDCELFIQHGIRISTMGDISRFPSDLQQKLQEMVERTRNIPARCTVILCANYGGKADIIQAVNKLIEQGGRNITEAEFARYLYGSEYPDPDLIVRTSGEQRISNFMLWQGAYSELLFIKPFWPDINDKTIDRCVIEFQKRQRRFGRV